MPTQQRDGWPVVEVFEKMARRASVVFQRCLLSEDDRIFELNRRPRRWDNHSGPSAIEIVSWRAEPSLPNLTLLSTFPFVTALKHSLYVTISSLKKVRQSRGLSSEPSIANSARTAMNQRGLRFRGLRLDYRGEIGRSGVPTASACGTVEEETSTTRSTARVILDRADFKRSKLG
ncbi:hypothetical protein NL676_003324 [Syzygium grande]|nr:hypothetical protein NL676_003324 [Syzygium grande]